LSINKIYEKRMKIKAISLHQPWASMVAQGFKTIETRNWYTPYRGDLLICSTLSPEIIGHKCGYALCIVNLHNCRPMIPSDAAAARCEYQKDLKQFSWVLTDIRKIEPPFPVRGRQSLFDVEIED